MKKFIMAALLAVASLSANAQMWLGGGLGFSSEKANKDAKSVNTFTFTPEFGYKVADDIAVGIDLSYESKSSDGTTFSAFGVAPFVRFTAATWNQVSLFFDGYFAYTSYNKDRGNKIGVGIQPGIAYTPTDAISFVAKLGNFGYSKYSDKAGGGSRVDLGFNTAAVTFGVYFNF